MSSLFPNALPAPMAGADVAYTPDHVARALVEVLRPELYGRTIWEPYVGGGAFVRALLDMQAALNVTDCDPAAEGLSDRVWLSQRNNLWDAAVPDEMLWIRERIAFQGPGRSGKETDMRDYAWVIWRKRAGSWMGRGLIGRVSTETGRVWRGVSNG